MSNIKKNKTIYEFIRYGGMFYIPVLVLTHFYTHNFFSLSGWLKSFADWFTSFYAVVMGVFGSMSFAAGAIFIIIFCSVYGGYVKKQNVN